MTGPNQQPPGDGVPPSDPTVAWWERPGEGAGQNPAQADPTVLRGNIGAPGPYTAPPTPYQSGANPQPYTAPPGPYQSGANPQPYPQQYAHPQAGAYQAPQPQWGAPPPRPPSSGNKAVWWIVGGAIVAVGALVIGLIAFTANKVDDNPFGPDPDKWAGSYVYKDGKNACDLVDLTVLNQWSSTRETTTHTERGPSEYIGGGSYDCDAKNKESGRNANDASLGLEVEFKTESETESDYARWKGYDTKTTGKDYDHGPVSGLGTEAYYASEQHTYGSIPSDYSVVVAAHDSNISVKVEIEVSTMRTVDKAAMRTAAETQVRKVLAALKK